MKSCALAACVAVAACAPSPSPSPSGASSPVGAAVAALAPGACHAGPVTLWLDFEGAGVVHAASDDSSAMPVASVLAPTNAVVPPFDATTIAPRVTRDQAIAAIVDRVRTLFLSYAVDVVTARPAKTPYTRILIGGDASALGVSALEAGLAQVDCGNGDASDVAYDFAAAQTPDYGGVVGIANYAAHEAGHTFGLEHVDDPDDVMYAAAQTQLTLPGLFTLDFGDSGAYTPFGSPSGLRSCTTADPIDEPSILGCAVGVASGGGDSTRPTVAWPEPTGPIVSPMMLTATASDDVGVVRVEAYKDLELIASLDAPPYDFVVEAAAGEHFYLTVEAIDAAGNRATLTRALVAAAATPAFDDGVGPPDDMALPSSTAPTTSSGCSFAAGAPSTGGFWLFLCLVLSTVSCRPSTAFTRWRRSSATGSSSPRRR